MPAVGASSYILTTATTAADPSTGNTAAATADSTSSEMRKVMHASSTDDTVLENDHVKLTFSAKTGRLAAWTNKEANVATMVEQDFCYYDSSPGGNHSIQPSGAYIFRPYTDVCNHIRQVLEPAVTKITAG
jgi:hypothetical protein